MTTPTTPTNTDPPPADPPPRRTLMRWIIGSSLRFRFLVAAGAVVMMAVFGLVFQLPVFLSFLAWVGILKSSGMKKTWRHAIVGISVVGLVITPSNDLFTMAIMIVPVILLYLGSIWLVQLIERKRARRKK